MKKDYPDDLSRAGLTAALPALSTWPNQFPKTEITIMVPEYTSICPKTHLPDFGTITIRYVPGRTCIELKSLKYYLLGYRNLGIFYENAVNRILEDIADACRPEWAIVKGEFSTRGGMHSIIEVRYDKPSKSQSKTSRS
ncbi:MAG: NADPH-dependent 7-cyano-7-deazaguanine reductase QueF [Acidobacteria bacterium]|nr:NADPH-dependent 7-cyano-7-deazaguanine reductase QueF [Acidobacteriota bacterium]